MPTPCFLIAYDIHQPKKRRRALKKLRNFSGYPATTLLPLPDVSEGVE
ncbi:CRISPR-associated endonuclease Cas2 [Shewanella oncorhynchi]|uniref:CRISPR-associated endonuclease Cas2 n=1 Tax=Shewanella oncorhynchi TaxID=2726434 RepID=A0AA50KG20_9GAMM|nr:CRISPR-associated endonuclease Cas2 [Shewanella oncorhynchi]WMB74790.1 CRISPR-associated endonuclease Cas2 [Shewanella oncorhynchi]